MARKHYSTFPTIFPIAPKIFSTFPELSYKVYYRDFYTFYAKILQKLFDKFIQNFFRFPVNVPQIQQWGS